MRRTLTGHFRIPVEENVHAFPLFCLCKYLENAEIKVFVQVFAAM